MNWDTILDKQFKMTDSGRIDRIRDLYTTFNHQVDLQALKDCGYLTALEEMMEPILNNFDDRSPEVIAYWAKRGMVKECHGDNDVMSWSEYESKTGYRWEGPREQGIQNLHKKWNSFVPVSAFRPENKDRKYPVVVVLHGGFNPISIIDGWGFVQEAAKREWIVVVPSIELDDILDEILAQAKALYPVDESRIYATGFSYGGFMSNFLGNKRPDVYAAVAPCGAPISNGLVEKAIGPEPQTPFDGKSRAKAMGVYMPVLNIAGNLDGNRFPVYDVGYPKDGAPDMMWHITPDLIVDGINHWLDVNDAPLLSVDAVMALKNDPNATEVEKNIGLPLSEGRKVVADGIVNYVGDLKSRDGVTRVRIMVEMNMPHWPTPEMSRQIFEFFSHFSRDPETKESIYTA